MTSIRLLAAAPAAALLLLSAAPAGAVIVVNPSFEVDGATSGPITGWSATDVQAVDCGLTFGAPFAGDCAVRLNAAPSPEPTISQSLSGFIIGADYRVDIAVANFFPGVGSASTDSLGIFMSDSLGPVSQSLTSSNALGLLDSETATAGFSHLFTATDSTMTLSIVSQLNSSDRSFYVDAVSVTEAAAAVPAPAAAPLLASALGAAALGLRRRARRARRG